MFKFILIIVAFSLSSQLFADSLNLVINGKAAHKEKRNFNEENWGLGFEYNFEEKNKWIYFANGGYFKDSLLNTSKYLGGGSKRRFMLEADKDGWHIDAGIAAFVMTRKDHKNGDPFFGALPFVSVGTSQFAINATYVPAVRPKSVALIFFQASFKLAQW